MHFKAGTLFNKENIWSKTREDHLCDVKLHLSQNLRCTEVNSENKTLLTRYRTNCVILTWPSHLKATKDQSSKKQRSEAFSWGDVSCFSFSLMSFFSVWCSSPLFLLLYLSLLPVVCFSILKYDVWRWKETGTLPRLPHFSPLPLPLLCFLYPTPLSSNFYFLLSRSLSSHIPLRLICAAAEFRNCGRGSTFHSPCLLQMGPWMHPPPH